MKILMVGGTWNKDGGKSSHLFEKLYDAIQDASSTKITYYNGGNYSELTSIINLVKNVDVVFWMANVPNDLPKVRNVKQINPKVIFVGSKRNIDNEYSFVDVLNRTIEQRHNLSIMFYKKSEDKEYNMMLFDPLGTYWYDGNSIVALANALSNRLNFLITMTRVRTYSLTDNNYVNNSKYNNKAEIPNDTEFFNYVQDVAEIFHKTIQHSDGVTRFLGNASFRDPKNPEVIHVTERDIDKAFLSRDRFVSCINTYGKFFYYGDKKPSKDTAVQINLYRSFPNINYIVHSHCYVKDGIWTQTPVPCGSLNELDEINDALDKVESISNKHNKTLYKFNLIGHGCLIMGATVKDLKTAEYITRQLPEKFEYHTAMTDKKLIKEVNEILKKASEKDQTIELQIIGVNEKGQNVSKYLVYSVEDFKRNDIGFMYELYKHILQAEDIDIPLDCLVSSNMKLEDKLNLNVLPKEYVAFLKARRFVREAFPIESDKLLSVKLVLNDKYKEMNYERW